MLPNPYYGEELRELNGTNPKVQEYVLSSNAAPDLIEGIHTITSLASREYASVHKFHAVVAIGCTGGKHRSVTITEKLAKKLADSDFLLLLAYAADRFAGQV